MTIISLHEEARHEFHSFKKSTSSRYIIFKIRNHKVVVDEIDSQETNESFLDYLPRYECRYAVYKKDYTTNDGTSQSVHTKLVFVLW
jgi:hypothetical protein